MQFLESKSIYYDDVNLIAKPNYLLTSRKDVPEEKWRIMVSPMPAVVGSAFAQQAFQLGLTVCLHRFCSKEEQLLIFNCINPDVANKTRAICSIGLNDDERFDYLLQNGVTCFCIDVANAYLYSVVQYAEKIYKKLGDQGLLMVGNIHSEDGVLLYKKIPNVLLRCGIGNGSGCDTTTKATGYGRGQITELQDCLKPAIGIICADGGIKNGSCAAKAFGVGSKYIMLGGYFSVAEEAQNIIDGEYKFWGCASTFNQAKYGEIRRHSEGKILEIDKNQIKPLKYLVDELWGGISSAVSYGGYSKLSDFISNGIFELKK